MQPAESRRGPRAITLDNTLFCVVAAVGIATLYMQGRSLASLEREVAALRAELGPRASGAPSEELAGFGVIDARRAGRPDRRLGSLDSSGSIGPPGPEGVGGALVYGRLNSPLMIDP